MSWKRLISLAAALGAAILAGCSSGRTAPAAPPTVASAEPLKERLANQARAIVELGAENEKLLTEVEALRKELARLRARLEALEKAVPAATPAPTPGPGPGPAPAPGAPAAPASPAGAGTPSPAPAPAPVPAKGK
ncbi:MAG TPA: hypothetical protein PK280_13655 [Planctomycetota bacterium]|nr:hypothetical protein [Planctomycetota bacterium]